MSRRIGKNLDLKKIVEAQLSVLFIIWVRLANAIMLWHHDQGHSVKQQCLSLDPYFKREVETENI